MGFKKTDPGWILNYLNPVNHPVLWGVFFIFVGPEPH